MKTKIEGIILTKHPQGDRNLILKLLLRSGKIVTVMFYGGRGGGEKKKASVLELGSMLKVELSRSRGGSDIYSAKEWEPLWMANKVRDNHVAFYVLCFIVQVAVKVAQEEDLHDESHSFDDHSQGVFRAVSNALVHLETMVQQNTFHASAEVAIYLGKLLIELGVFPDIKSCMVCGVILEQFTQLQLSSEHGGFVCHNCSHGDKAQFNLWRLMSEVAVKKSPEIVPDASFPRSGLDRLWEYFCFQSQLEPKDFKTLTMIP